MPPSLSQNDLELLSLLVQTLTEELRQEKSLWQATLDANTGRTILSADDVLTIDGITQSLRTHPFFGYIADGIGYPELSFYWEAIRSALQSQVRLDHVHSYPSARRSGTDYF
jgi:hypothetical protein